MRISTSPLVTIWIVLVVGVSIAAMVDGGYLWGTLSLAPAQVWRGEVWRLVTWVFVEPSPIALIFTVVAIYRFAGDLAPVWGDRRLFRYMFDLLLGSAVITCFLGLIFDSVFLMYRDAGWAVDDVLVIAWARQFPTREIVLYRMIHLTGGQIVMVTLAVTGLFAFAAGILPWAPELLACIGAATYSSSRLSQR